MQYFLINNIWVLWHGVTFFILFLFCSGLYFLPRLDLNRICKVRVLYKGPEGPTKQHLGASLDEQIRGGLTLH